MTAIIADRLSLILAILKSSPYNPLCWLVGPFVRLSVSLFIGNISISPCKKQSSLFVSIELLTQI